MHVIVSSHFGGSLFSEKRVSSAGGQGQVGHSKLQEELKRIDRNK